ncbi:hypothetical protein E2320_014562, partial [Naja naja]
MKQSQCPDIFLFLFLLLFLEGTEDFTATNSVCQASSKVSGFNGYLPFTIIDGNVCFGNRHKRQNVKRSVIFLQSLPLSSIQNTQEKRGTP